MSAVGASRRSPDARPGGARARPGLAPELTLRFAPDADVPEHMPLDPGDELGWLLDVYDSYPGEGALREVMDVELLAELKDLRFVSPSLRSLSDDADRAAAGALSVEQFAAALGTACRAGALTEWDAHRLYERASGVTLGRAELGEVLSLPARTADDALLVAREVELTNAQLAAFRELPADIYEDTLERLEAQRTAIRICARGGLAGDPVFLTRFLSCLSGQSASSTEKVGGLGFEGVLEKALLKAGYKVTRFTPGNAGADMEVELHGRRVLVSLKSTTAKRGRSGGSISMSSLAPNPVRAVPEDFAAFERTREATLEHLDRYEQILYLQCSEDGYPTSADDSRGQAGAWRYDLVEVPHRHIRDSIAAITEAEFSAARTDYERRRARGQKQAKLRVERTAQGRKTFRFHVGAEATAVTAVQPDEYRLNTSYWVPPAQANALLPPQT